MITSQVASSVAFAQGDPAIDAERASCAKNTAYTWDAARNRCIQNRDAQAARHEVEDCAAIQDVEQRKQCHMRIAEKKTGMNSDPNALPEGSGGAGNMAMINAAYAMIGLISSLGKGGGQSSCTSKKIFGVTSIAGTVSDIWLKIKAKDAMNALKDKYQLGVKNNAYDNQSKAFEYLKEEQQTVKEIAGREKKRNMLLMLGYGAASVMAIYEMTPYGANPDCYKKEEKAPAKKTEEASPANGENGDNGDKGDKGDKGDTSEAVDTTDKTPKCNADGTIPAGATACTNPIAQRGEVESRELTDDPKKKVPETTPVTANASASEAQADTTTPKKQYVAEQRNGVTQIRSVDGQTSIVGDRIIDKSGNVIGRVDSTVEIRRVGVEAPISPSDYKRYGVYSSGATDNASRINFTNSATGGRTTVNGSTTIINDGKLKKK